MAHCSHHIGGVIGGRTLQVNVTSGELWKQPMIVADSFLLALFVTGHIDSHWLLHWYYNFRKNFNKQFPSPRIRPGFNVALPFACSGFTIATWKAFQVTKKGEDSTLVALQSLVKSQELHTLTHSSRFNDEVRLVARQAGCLRAK